MKDQLEEFVNRNRDAFDDREPSDKTWNAIEAGLPKGKQISLWNSVGLWRAAAVILMIITGYLLIQPKIAGAPGKDMAMSDFHDVEQFYFGQISEKVNLIDDFHRNEGLNGFTHDFQQLEAMYSVLKEEMKNRPSEKVKEALVLNLLVRVDLLNQQLHHLEQSYKTKEKKPESNT